jgi:hypothetical protein
MVVPARPARMSAASVSAPIAAGWPDAVTKRRHASTLGPIDPAGNVRADSAPVSMAGIGRASGVLAPDNRASPRCRRWALVLGIWLAGSLAVLAGHGPPATAARTC